MSQRGQVPNMVITSTHVWLWAWKHHPPVFTRSSFMGTGAHCNDAMTFLVSSAVCVQRVSSHTHKDAIMHASAAVNSSSRKELLLKLNSAHSNQPDHKVGGRDLRGTGALMWLVKSSVTVYCVKPRYTVAAAEVYNSENNVCELSTVLFPYYH